MEAAPPVVAVVVAHDPGPWFEECLASIAAQDYAELSMLVLDAHSAEDLTERVARVVPTAYVRRMDGNRGFAATVDEVPSMVDGAAYYLLCHDDVALFPGVVHLLVEEAFRSNAGVVAPKVVSWDDPARLVHVGMAVDKTGAVVERVHPHELDHGQHDAVRDVFLAPGGCTLIRADLFADIGGFDADIVAMGEDLDFCWRAQLAGARVIVAPDARIRHREELAGGARVLEPSLLPDQEEGAGRAPTLQELQRRHELLATLKCYGRFHLVRVVPQALVLGAGEVVVAELSGDRERARAVVRAWRWNLARLGALREQRSEVRRHRRLGDHDVRQLQLRGSARLAAYGRRLFQHGFHGAYADELAGAGAGSDEADTGLDGDVSDAPRLEPRPASSPPSAPSSVPASERGRVATSTRLACWLLATLVVVVGSRDILTGRLPVVGQFAPFPSWSATFGQFFAGWHPGGVGTTAPATPALALVGGLGTVLLGAMGLAEKVLVFACLPLGAWGTVRLVRPFGSQRASLVAGLVYLAVPLPYDALGTGRLGTLVVYAGTPWVLAILFRAASLPPFSLAAEPSPPAARTAARRASEEEASEPSGDGARRARRRTASRARRRDRVAALPAAVARRRDLLLLGLLEAVLVSFAPAAAVVVAVVALALAGALAVAGARRAALRVLGCALGATVVAGLICLPWAVGVLSAGRSAVAVFGAPLSPSAALGWSSVIRLSDGPVGGSVLGWGFAVAALAPLVLGRGLRFGWAARLWAVTLASWVLSWVVGRGWTGSFAPDVTVLLVPAAVAVAASVGLGVSAFEEDVPRAAFGWRQLVTGVAALFTVLAAVPTLVSAAAGSWELPPNDFAQALGWMPARSAAGAFRVLWLGDPRALTLGSWSAGEGLAYATSEDGPPDARWLWNAADPGPAAGLGADVDLARAQATDRLGRLLSPAGVRYLVVLTALAPQIPGEQTPESLPVPGDLAPGLDRQLDLATVLSGTGMTVYENLAWRPVRTEVLPAGGAPRLRPVLPGPAASTSYTGPLVAGTVSVAAAPSGRWVLAVNGRQAPSAPAGEWGRRYAVVAAGSGRLGFDGGPWPALALAYSVLGWLAAAAAVGARRRAERRVVRPVERQWARRRRPRLRREAASRTGEAAGAERDAEREPEPVPSTGSSARP